MASEIAEAPKVKKTKEAQADPVQDFNRYLKAFAAHKKAQEYCEAREPGLEDVGGRLQEPQSSRPLVQRLHHLPIKE
jgi:hypothetical protein